MRSKWFRRDYEIEGDDGELKLVSVEVQCEYSLGGRDEAGYSEVDWRKPIPLLSVAEQGRLEVALNEDTSLFEDAAEYDEPDWDAMNDERDDR